MKPVNNKSLLHFIFDQMEKLDKGEVDVSTAREMANLAQKAQSSIRIETERANTLIKLDAHNRTFGTDIRMRNVEGKDF